MMDTYNQPYECVSEEVAQNWHKECMQPQNRSEDLCRYDGKKFSKLLQLEIKYFKITSMNMLNQ